MVYILKCLIIYQLEEFLHIAVKIICRVHCSLKRYKYTDTYKTRLLLVLHGVLASNTAFSSLAFIVRVTLLGRSLCERGHRLTMHLENQKCFSLSDALDNNLLSPTSTPDGISSIRVGKSGPLTGFLLFL